ncbi:MAG: DHH family phosphoesterase [Mogibacterium sp.]|nr:DHH family phosphoesterase [Mogibacterium sp.]
MNEKLKKNWIAIVVLLAACLIAFVAGRASGRGQMTKEIDRMTDEQNLVHELNRSSIEGMSVGDGPVYVIGHRSPDADTVCSAIAYARLLNMLGFEAEAVITEPVNRETAMILKEAGVEKPPVLEDASGETVFLVDHSEYAQAVEGMKDAHIVGILDHHGVGSVTTGHQIVYEARPIGSTATIVWLDYLNYGLEIDPVTAYLLLGAVLSDTGGLKGTTTTEADRQAVPALAKIAGVEDTDALYHALHAESLSYAGMTDEEILFSDYKEYEASGVTFGIGLVNAIDEESARELSGRMKNALPAGYASHDVELMYASVGIRENDVKIDYIIPANEHSKEVFEEAFPNYDEYDGTAFIFRTGLGRKTKFVPGLTEFLAAHPHE